MYSFVILFYKKIFLPIFTGEYRSQANSVNSPVPPNFHIFFNLTKNTLLTFLRGQDQSGIRDPSTPFSTPSTINNKGRDWGRKYLLNMLTNKFKLFIYALNPLTRWAGLIACLTAWTTFLFNALFKRTTTKGFFKSWQNENKSCIKIENDATHFLAKPTKLKLN